MLTRDQIEAIIRQALELPDTYDLNEDLRPAFIPGWDSIGWINIITAIEGTLGKEVPFDALDNVSTLRDLYAVLTSM